MTTHAFDHSTSADPSLPNPVSAHTPDRQVLRGQVALVTGASSGIGRAAALAPGKAGAQVVVNHVGAPDEANIVVAEIRAANTDAIAVRADVSNEAEVREMFRVAIDEPGTVDILVNNVGIQQDAPFEQMTLAQWERVLAVNLTGQFLCAREAVREFKRRGVRPAVSCVAGKIICMSSAPPCSSTAG